MRRSLCTLLMVILPALIMGRTLQNQPQRPWSPQQIDDAWMMVPNWVRGESTPEGMGVTLDQMIDNIDHICQLSGNAFHVGIGSDLDGAFGKEQSPVDLDTIADLQKIPLMLSKKGYTKIDVENIMSQNFIKFLNRVWKTS